MDIAIKGHRTRGNEIIELLKMLGGKYGQYVEYFGNEPTLVYYINDHGYISADEINNRSICVMYTLEEFEAMYSFTKGDVVMDIHNGIGVVDGLQWSHLMDDLIYIVKYVKPITLATGAREWVKQWKPHELKKIDLNEYMGLTYQYYNQCMDADNIIIDTKLYNTDNISILFNDEFEPEIVGNKIVLKRQTKLKTFEECAKYLDTYYPTNYGYKGGLVESFQKLLICRDAYWKLAGNWQPDWKDKSKPKYVILSQEGDIILRSEVFIRTCFLAFPTIEMRDAFYENFKELIKACKEFLQKKSLEYINSFDYERET